MTTSRNSTRKKARVKAKTPVPGRPQKATNGRHHATDRNGNGNGHGPVSHEKSRTGKANGKAATSAPSLSPREQIQRERAQVMGELARLRAELKEKPESTGDEVDLSVYDREKTLGLITSFELRLEKLDHALVASDKGEYGTCLRCKQPIDAERLRIFPETRHCVKCKTQIEQLARRGIVVT